jgi:hypothetical protein
MAPTHSWIAISPKLLQRAARNVNQPLGESSAMLILPLLLNRVLEKPFDEQRETPF